MKLGFEGTKTSPWMSNIFEKHIIYVSIWESDVKNGKNWAETGFFPK
jgi:hypothetical protein